MLQKRSEVESKIRYRDTLVYFASYCNKYTPNRIKSLSCKLKTKMSVKKTDVSIPY